MPRVQLYGNGVAHGSGGHEQGGFLAEDFGCPPLQAIDGGVFAIHVVAHFRFRHRSSHAAGQGRVTVSLRKSMMRVESGMYKLLKNFIREQNATRGEPESRAFALKHSFPQPFRNRRGKAFTFGSRR